jgi:type I restriction enzyme S subunit
VQQGVVLPDVRNFPVPKFSDMLTTKVEKAMHESAAEKERADCLYPEAGAELLDRLDWEKLRQQPVELSYARDFSELTASGRADAEFFQPQYARLRAQLNQRGAQTIGAFCSKVSRGVQPQLIEGGEVVVVDSKAVRPIGVEPTASERTSRAFWSLPQNTKGRIQDGDVLLNSTGRGTLGRASYYRLKEPGLCDNHVAILRPEAKVCHPIYLALFLNSPAGLAQSEQFQTGSSGQLEIYPQHISQFLVFLPLQTNGKLDLVWQQRLVAKVESAAGAKAAARAKLEEATRLVEDATR